MSKVVQVRVPVEYAGIANEILKEYTEDNKLDVRFLDIIPEVTITGIETITYVVGPNNSVMNRIKFHNFVEFDLREKCHQRMTEEFYAVNRDLLAITGGVNEYAK